VGNRDFKDLAGLGWFSTDMRRPLLLLIPVIEWKTALEKKDAGFHGTGRFFNHRGLATGQ